MGGKYSFAQEGTHPVSSEFRIGPKLMESGGRYTEEETPVLG